MAIKVKRYDPIRRELLVHIDPAAYAAIEASIQTASAAIGDLSEDAVRMLGDLRRELRGLDTPLASYLCTKDRQQERYRGRVGLRTLTNLLLLAAAEPTAMDGAGWLNYVQY